MRLSQMRFLGQPLLFTAACLSLVTLIMFQSEAGTTSTTVNFDTDTNANLIQNGQVTDDTYFTWAGTVDMVAVGGGLHRDVAADANTNSAHGRVEEEASRGLTTTVPSVDTVNTSISCPVPCGVSSPPTSPPAAPWGIRGTIMAP